MPITAQELHTAYRTLFNRDPEPDIVTEETLSYYRDAEELRAALLSSSEGRSRMYDFVLEDLPSWVRLETPFGRKIYVNIADRAVSKSIILEKRWEPEVANGVLSHLKPDSVFLDIGANIGWFTLLAADYLDRQSGSGKVIAIEANPTVIPYLAASVVESGLSDRVQLKPYAVSDRTGLVEINAMSTGNLGGIGIGEVLERDSDCHIAPTVRLEDLLRHETRIDLIKIDIEGAEYLALKGAQKMLEKHRPTIIAELNPVALTAVSGQSVAGLVGFLADLGYQAFDFRGSNFDDPIDVAAVEALVSQRQYYDLLFKAA